MSNAPIIMPAAPLTTADGDAPGHMMVLHNPATTGQIRMTGPDGVRDGSAVAAERQRHEPEPNRRWQDSKSHSGFQIRLAWQSVQASTTGASASPRKIRSVEQVGSISSIDSAVTAASEHWKPTALHSS